MGNSAKTKVTQINSNEQPVVFSRIPRKSYVGNRIRSFQNTDAFNAAVSSRPKSQSEREEINFILKSHFVFSSLSSEFLRHIIDDMLLYSLEKGQVVFYQGTPGHTFFIVERGKLEVIINHKTKAYLKKGQTFGELALIHNSERTATIRTVEASCLWGISTQTVRKMIQKVCENSYKDTKAFVSEIPLFSMLTKRQKASVTDICVPEKYKDREKIVIEGDPGSSLYIIKEGKVSCSLKGKEIRKMGRGEFFGEQALIYGSPRTLTVKALGKTKVLSIGKEQLLRALGDSLNSVIYKNSIRFALEKLDFTSNQIDSIASTVKVESFCRGQTVVQEGNYGQHWIVLKGTLQGSKNGLEVHQGNSLADDPTSYQGFVAKTDVDVAFIERKTMENCIGSSFNNFRKVNEFIKVLRSVPLFRNIPTPIIEKFASKLKVTEFEDEEMVFCEGDPGRSFYIVNEGSVSVLRNGVCVRTIGKNEYFGERSILFDEDRSATIVSKGKSSLCVLDKNDLLSLLDNGIRRSLLNRIALQDDKIELNDLRLVKKLGQGTFGEVFLALHESKEVLYALKRVPRYKIAKYELQTSLQSERRILLESDHPFIVRLVKTFKNETNLYFLMEYVRGQSMLNVLRILKALSDSSSVFYIACFILVLEHLHNKKIVYRDLKPENILIDEVGYPKLIDFGTAKIIKERTYTVVGTPHYMAPEVILGRGHSFSADLWSLGVIFYELSYGDVPFGSNEHEPYRIYEKIIERNLSYPESMNRKIEFIDQLLSKNPAFRGHARNLRLHSLFSACDWDKIQSKMVKPPFVPKCQSLDKEIGAATVKNQEFTLLNNSPLSYDDKAWDDEF